MTDTTASVYSLQERSDDCWGVADEQYRVAAVREMWNVIARAREGLQEPPVRAVLDGDSLARISQRGLEGPRSVDSHVAITSIFRALATLASHRERWEGYGADPSTKWLRKMRADLAYARVNVAVLFVAPSATREYAYGERQHGQELARLQRRLYAVTGNDDTARAEVTAHRAHGCSLLRALHLTTMRPVWEAQVGLDGESTSFGEVFTC